MARYIIRKILVYLVVFFFAISLNWMIPRLMPGDPVQSMISRAGMRADSARLMTSYYTQAFGLDVPLFQQYLNYWRALFQLDFGTSIYLFPTPVLTVIRRAVPYTLMLVLPAILLSWWAGNSFGAFAARSKKLDNTVLPLGYLVTATPYMWMAIVLSFVFGAVFRWFPLAGGYSFALRPAFTWRFITNLLHHWFLPFMSLFLVMFGGWAIGMRNMVIYELESDYAHYLEAAGAPRRLIRKYAFRNAILPQITGLALQLGVIIAGNVVTEAVFAYPGLGSLLLAAVQNQDYFLMQGSFTIIIIGVLLANFTIDIVYIIVDPRTRVGMQGGD
ncbi:ABC transporter permease [Spirochaeta dissipatitropha]